MLVHTQKLVALETSGSNSIIFILEPLVNMTHSKPMYVSIILYKTIS